MTFACRLLTKTMRPLFAGLAVIALLAACDEAAVPPVSPSPQSPAIPAGPAPDDPAVLHAGQTVGGPVDQSRLAKALSICLDNIATIGNARQQMILNGFRRETTVNGQDLYSAAGRSVFALISIGSDTPRCAVGRDGLRGQAAVDFAEAALRQAYGPAFVPADPADFSRPMEAGWVATLPSGYVAIGVTPVIDLSPFLLGSFIMVTTEVTDSGGS